MTTHNIQQQRALLHNNTNNGLARPVRPPFSAHLMAHITRDHHSRRASGRRPQSPGQTALTEQTYRTDTPAHSRSTSRDAQNATFDCRELRYCFVIREHSYELNNRQTVFVWCLFLELPCRQNMTMQTMLWGRRDISSEYLLISALRLSRGCHLFPKVDKLNISWRWIGQEGIRKLRTEKGPLLFIVHYRHHSRRFRLHKNGPKLTKCQPCWG